MRAKLLVIFVGAALATSAAGAGARRGAADQGRGAPETQKEPATPLQRSRRRRRRSP